MILKKLYLDNFGKFHNREIDLQPGMNIIYGENEAGKTTVHSFIQGMIFGLERLRAEAPERMSIPTISLGYPARTMREG